MAEARKVRREVRISAGFRTKQVYTRNGVLFFKKGFCKPKPIVSVCGEGILGHPADVAFEINCCFMDNRAANLKLLDELTAVLRKFIERGSRKAFRSFQEIHPSTPLTSL